MTFRPLTTHRPTEHPGRASLDVENAQTVTLGRNRNEITYQVSHSDNPPLYPRQAQQLAQPVSGVEHYERAVPGLRALRQAARALAEQSNHLQPEEVAKRRMALEGELLIKHPHLDFHQAGELLDMGQTRVMAARVPYAGSMAQLQTRIGELFNDPDGALPSNYDVCNALDESFSCIAKHLEGHEAFYHQTLQGTLTDTERQQIEAGHRALVRLADRWQGATQQLLDDNLNIVSQRLNTALAELEPLQATPPKNYEEAQQLLRAEQKVQRWQELQGYFTDMKHSSSPNSVAAAVQRVHLDDHIEELHAARKGWFNQLSIALAEGGPQGIASMLQFVLARAYVDPRLSLLNLVTQSAGNGSALGAVHETLDNFAKPATIEFLASLGMSQTDEVPVESLIHDAAHATVVNGRYHERTDSEMAAERSQVEQARMGFRNSQQDYGTGTLKGDALTYLNQPMAQMVRHLLGLTTHLNTATVGVGAVTSFAGGVGMSSSQALGKINKTYRHDGRDLPTHVPKAAPKDSLYQRLAHVIDKGLPTIDPRRSEARENYASKIWSSTEAMLAYNAIGRAMGSLDTSTLAGAAGSVVLANLQALGLLLPFYANRQSGSEAKADGTNRVESAVANMLDPDRDTLAHGTQPNTSGRQAENLYNRVRGLTQLVPQIGTVLTEAAVAATERGLGGALNMVARQRADGPATTSQPGGVAVDPPRPSLGSLNASLDLETGLATSDEPARSHIQPPGAWQD